MDSHRHGLLILLVIYLLLIICWPLSEMFYVIKFVVQPHFLGLALKCKVFAFSNRHGGLAMAVPLESLHCKVSCTRHGFIGPLIFWARKLYFLVIYGIRSA